MRANDRLLSNIEGDVLPEDLIREHVGGPVGNYVTASKLPHPTQRLASLP
ncbi:MAG: hypothetical protein V5A40_00610 [Haloarculaceae archaeon]